MKLIKVTTYYPNYWRKFYSDRPGLEELSYAEQKRILHYDAYGWSDWWTGALNPLGYEVTELITNIEPLQRAWARENLTYYDAGCCLEELAIKQIKRFAPDVLWFEDVEESLLNKLKSDPGTIRLIIGWSGSAILQSGAWRQYNLILSCAPEAVEYFRKLGLKAEHMHHGFDERIIKRVPEISKEIDVAFIGYILQHSDFHCTREKILNELAGDIDLKIFTPMNKTTFLEYVKNGVKYIVYNSLNTLSRSGAIKTMLEKNEKLSKLLNMEAIPTALALSKLRPYLRQGVYGLDLFRVIKKTRILLNIHADSSPFFASNMRLFETTGMGSCLVTDWKQNISNLFDPDTEIVTFKTASECVEKVKWLLANPQKVEEISKKGQLRCLKSHSVKERAKELDFFIKKYYEKNN